MSDFTFPKDFLWGIATSAAQIEGGAFEDGKGANIWDIFSRIPGKIYNGETPDVTCDYYHKYPEQLRMVKELGFNAYRFSFSWARVMPDGFGHVNQKGLDFYKRTVDTMLENGLVPCATLYHWDLPQELEYRGGFLNRDIVKWFGDYAELLFDTFKDTIPLWATVNEPIATYVGYALGGFAPGKKLESFGRQANHNILMCHGEAVRRFRKISAPASKIGIVVDIWHHHPARPENEADIRMAELENEKAYRSYLYPILQGKYSDALLKYMSENNCMPDIHEGDMELIAQPIDFFGLNCYNRVVDSADPEAARHVIEHAGGNYMDNGAEFYPKAIYDALHILKDDFKLQIPIYITENGTYNCSEEIVTGEDGTPCVHDSMRVRYYQGFLKWLAKAMAEGIDVRGFFAWTLLDNFEWTAGSSFRFGMVHCDYGAKEYIYKDSAHWFREFLKDPRIADLA